MATEFRRIGRHRGKWVAIVNVDGERQRWSLGNIPATPERREDAARAAEVLKKGLAAPIGNTCADIYKAYLKDREASERVLVDKGRIENAWKVLEPHFGKLTAADVTRDECRAYIKKRREIGRGDGTIRKELGVLSAALNWHDKKGPQQFELPPPPPPREISIDQAQFRRLLDAAAGTFHLTVFLHLAIATAGRKEALFQLKWTQVRWPREEIWLGIKVSGKKRATVPMTPTLKAVLQQAQEVALTDNVIEFEGEPVKSVRTSLDTACRKAGLWRLDDEGEPLLDKDGEKIPLVTPHVLRHSAGVWMAAAGRPLEEICDYMGHTDIRVTKRVYAKYRPEHLKQAASALDVGQRTAVRTYHSDVNEA